MLSIFAVPMLITAILCTVLALLTWSLRHTERIHGVFALFSLLLALDAAVNLLWFIFGSVEHIDTWMRAAFVLGMLVPMGLVLFFYTFTGYDRHGDERVLWLPARGMFWGIESLVGSFALLSAFTDLFVTVPDVPQDIWDLQLGPIGQTAYLLFLLIFLYIFLLAWKAFRRAESRSRRRFIGWLTGGTIVWIMVGYIGDLLLPTSDAAYQFVAYLGMAVMAVIYFVAILNYQADQLHELNVSLEQKVVERTRHLEETRAQLVQSEKMAALGHLVAGVAHEMNTPVGAVYSTHTTIEAALAKLRVTLQDQHGINLDATEGPLRKVMRSLSSVSEVIRTSGERITGIIQRLKLFARLDEAEVQVVALREPVESAVEMFRYHLQPGIELHTEFADLPPVTCYPARIGQLVFQLLRNANQAIEGPGTITVRTRLEDRPGSRESFAAVEVSDTGRGIAPEHVTRIFDPGFTAWDLTVGTGLGLAISTRIAHDHNGSLTVSSDPGQGTTFTFAFPTAMTT